VRAVGSTGEKRHGRRHLPKVGTPKDMAYELHERREEALHPFSDHPDRRRSPAAAWIAVAVVIVISAAVAAFVLLT
jgi:hypothetical protein